jgi:Flp pilus assembly protein TadG
VLFALVPPVLLGALGLAIEVGFALGQRQRMQAASDLPAQRKVWRWQSPKADGFDATVVTIVTPYSGDVNRLQVSLAQPVATPLLGMLNFSSFNISGNYTTSGNAALAPTPETGAATVPDPLASLSPLTAAGLPTPLSPLSVALGGHQPGRHRDR